MEFFYLCIFEYTIFYIISRVDEGAGNGLPNNGDRVEIWIIYFYEKRNVLEFLTIFFSISILIFAFAIVFWWRILSPHSYSNTAVPSANGRHLIIIGSEDS